MIWIISLRLRRSPDLMRVRIAGRVNMNLLKNRGFRHKGLGNGFVEDVKNISS